jgi:hypothetical protein
MYIGKNGIMKIGIIDKVRKGSSGQTLAGG